MVFQHENCLMCAIELQYVWSAEGISEEKCHQSYVYRSFQTVSYAVQVVDFFPVMNIWQAFTLVKIYDIHIHFMSKQYFSSWLCQNLFSEGPISGPWAV